MFELQQVDRILCTGDIVGYFDQATETVDLLKTANCDCVIGNHDEDYLSSDDQTPAVTGYLSSLPRFLEQEIAGIRIYMVHAEPPDKLHDGIKLLDESGNVIETRLQEWQSRLSGFDADILIVGHTHQVYTTTVDGLLVINPGSLAFNHSCMILNLPEKSVETFAVGNQKIVPSWNFGLQFKQQ